MAYTFGAALDHPLAVHRFEYRDSTFTANDTVSPFPLHMQPLTIYPHTNWRGDYQMGTFMSGETGRCVQVRADEEDHTVTDGTPSDGKNIVRYTQYCLAAMKWPGKYIWLDNSMRNTPPGDPDAWMGSLVHNKRDLTGNLYMRNRYYDPQAGRFTQEDPIGLAGGLNAYGFAAGDPVSYSDPYGLCPESMRAPDGMCPGGLSTERWNSVEEAAGTLDDHERSQVMEKLQAGGYSDADLGTEKAAHAVLNFDGTHSVVLNTNPQANFFGYQAGDRGWVLSHEHGHGLQNEGTVADRRILWDRMNLQLFSGLVGQMGRAFQMGLERDANRHACAHSNPGIAFSPLCSP